MQLGWKIYTSIDAASYSRVTQAVPLEYEIILMHSSYVPD
jgi:hypothetical protein